MSDYKQTIGAYRVGVSFNPGGNPLVDEIKRKAADLIDLIDTIPGDEGDTQWEKSNAVARLKALAATKIEDAAMWAVKAATKPERE